MSKSATTDTETPTTALIPDAGDAPMVALGQSSDDARISLLRHIAAPLLDAVERAPGPDGESQRSLAENAQAFADLVESTIQINNQLASILGTQSSSIRDRWLAAEAVAAWTAAHYRSTGQVLTPDEAGVQINTLAGAIDGALSVFAPSANATAGDGDVLARSLKALAPAAAAVARYSFGQNTNDLIGEVTNRLTILALDLTNHVAGVQDGADVLETPMYVAMLEIMGFSYKHAHRGEMDRLLSMPAEERRAYVRAHDRRVPMDPVWEAVDLQVSMLKAMVSHIPLPSAKTASA